MNIDLKNSLLRFTVPPSLFYSLLYLRDVELLPLSTGEEILTQTTVLLIIFVACGFSIAAVGLFFSWLVEQATQPPWLGRETIYWEDIGKTREYTQRKIETVWSFYSMNMNSVLAVFAAIIYIHHKTGEHPGGLVLILLSTFVWSTVLNYQKVFRIAKEITSS